MASRSSSSFKTFGQQAWNQFQRVSKKSSSASSMGFNTKNILLSLSEDAGISTRRNMTSSSFLKQQQQSPSFFANAAKSAANKSARRAATPVLAIAADLLVDAVMSDGVGGVAWQLEEAEDEDDDGGG